MIQSLHQAVVAALQWKYILLDANPSICPELFHSKDTIPLLDLLRCYITSIFDSSGCCRILTVHFLCQITMRRSG